MFKLSCFFFFFNFHFIIIIFDFFFFFADLVSTERVAALTSAHVMTRLMRLLANAKDPNIAVAILVLF